MRFADCIQSDTEVLSHENDLDVLVFLPEPEVGLPSRVGVSLGRSGEAPGKSAAF